MTAFDRYVSPDSGYVRPLSQGESERYGYKNGYGFFLSANGEIYAWGSWHQMVELEAQGFEVHTLH
jgi:hypothetical protein